MDTHITIPMARLIELETAEHERDILRTNTQSLAMMRRPPLSDQPAPRDQRASAGTGVQVPDGLQCFAAVRAHSASRSGRAGTHSPGDATGADIPAHYNPDLRPPQAG